MHGVMPTLLTGRGTFSRAARASALPARQATRLARPPDPTVTVLLMHMRAVRARRRARLMLRLAAGR